MQISAVITCSFDSSLAASSTEATGLCVYRAGETKYVGKDG